MKLSLEYIQICIEYLNQLDGLRGKNLAYILDKLGGLSKKQYDQKCSQIDKDYFAMMGLAKRMKVPDNITLD
jgi:hypothetical protein